MMAHNHADFPSDVFTIFAAAGATLTIGSATGATTMDLWAFLTADMTGLVRCVPVAFRPCAAYASLTRVPARTQVILSVLLPPLAPGETLYTYKIMPRHQNAHAYVNAGIRMTLDASLKGPRRSSQVLSCFASEYECV